MNQGVIVIIVFIIFTIFLNYISNKPQKNN